VGTVLILAEFQAHTLYLMSPALMRARSAKGLSLRTYQRRARAR